MPLIQPIVGLQKNIRNIMLLKMENKALGCGCQQLEKLTAFSLECYGQTSLSPANTQMFFSG